MNLLQKLAASARPEVFVIDVATGRHLRRRLWVDDTVRVVGSPRHASILVVAVPIPPAVRSAARLIHDQISHPRAVVAVGRDSQTFPCAVVADDLDAVGPRCARVFADIQTGQRASSPPLLAGDNPVEWRGVGPHGQGGEGMMGGRPYGRSMAMTGPDIRDGLQLAEVSMTLGPFLSWMPPGLELVVVMQGDVIQTLTPRVPAGLPIDIPDVFVRAQTEAVSVAELEYARARRLLEAAADLMVVHGLDAAAKRLIAVAADAPPSGPAAIPRRLASWTTSLGARGIGQFDEALVAGLGPIARAAGRREDARSDDPAYRRLDFEPVTHRRGDARARVEQWLAEAVQAVDLAGRAGDRVRQPGPTLEGPRGPMKGDLGPRWQRLLSEYALGQTWDEFVTMLTSLNLDPARLPPSGDYGDARVADHDSVDGDG